MDKTYRELRQTEGKTRKLITIRISDRELAEFVEWFGKQPGSNLSDFTRMLWKTSADYQEWRKRRHEETEALTG